MEKSLPLVNPEQRDSVHDQVKNPGGIYFQSGESLESAVEGMVDADREAE